MGKAVEKAPAAVAGRGEGGQLEGVGQSVKPGGFKRRAEAAEGLRRLFRRDGIHREDPVFCERLAQPPEVVQGEERAVFDGLG